MAYDVSEEDIIDDLARANSYLSNLIHTDILKAQSGCTTCCNPLSDCLKNIINALSYKLEYEEFDDVSDKLYTDMLEIIGQFIIPESPSVTGGANQSIVKPASATFVATITEGSSDIDSILWEQVSGPNTATLSGSTTATLVVSNTIVGVYIFKITVTDNNNLQAVDTVQLTVTAQGMTIYFGWKNTITALTQSQILAGNSMTATIGEDFTVSFAGAGEPLYLWFAQPQNEPDKTEWQDTVFSFNGGNIGSDEDLFSAKQIISGFDFYITNYQTEQVNPIEFKAD